ncbi:MAG: multiubiquitin domain-containing protein [Betaproteobacteria bacterium]|nr:multiubiquitin domain-containing protein [Betaproteobacteria bacterium]
MNESKHAKYHFFVDNKKYETDHASLSALEIKNLAGVPSNHQLFLEERGNDPDRALSDGEAIDLANPPKHFYSVPPATFGHA